MTHSRQIRFRQFQVLLSGDNLIWYGLDDWGRLWQKTSWDDLGWCLVDMPKEIEEEYQPIRKRASGASQIDMKYLRKPIPGELLVESGPNYQYQESY